MIERIVPIVEGHGEVSAVPVLLRRLLMEMGAYIEVSKPDRTPRSSLIVDGGIESAVQRAAQDAGPAAALLVLIDADDDKVCELGPILTKRAQLARPDRRVLVSLAHVEFEHWFIAAAESLQGYRRLPSNLARPANFESIRDGKGWLSKQMPIGVTYSPIADQAALTARMDLDLARQHSASFRRFCTRFRELLG